MKPAPLSDLEVDQLLRHELRPPQPSSAWRDRVLAATLRADAAAAEAARARALDELRSLTQRRVAAERQRMLRRVLGYLLIALPIFALLPLLTRELAPAFGTVPALGLNGLSLIIAAGVVCAVLSDGLSRRLRGLLGV